MQISNEDGSFLNQHLPFCSFLIVIALVLRVKVKT